MTNQDVLVSVSQLVPLNQSGAEEEHFILFLFIHSIYVISRMEYEERNRKKEAKEIAVLEVMEKMKEAENQ